MEILEKLESESESLEKHPRKVFIEIGTNSSPATFMGNKDFKENTYIGIDINYDNSLRAKEATEITTEENDENLHFINADAEKLPIADSSVDELYFGNVFGDPSIKTKSLG